jgi:hypothetical protein
LRVGGRKLESFKKVVIEFRDIESDSKGFGIFMKLVAKCGYGTFEVLTGN